MCNMKAYGCDVFVICFNVYSLEMCHQLSETLCPKSVKQDSDQRFLNTGQFKYDMKNIFRPSHAFLIFVTFVEIIKTFMETIFSNVL